METTHSPIFGLIKDHNSAITEEIIVEIELDLHNVTGNNILKFQMNQLNTS